MQAYGFADRELVTEFYKIMCPEQNAVGAGRKFLETGDAVRTPV